MIHKSYLVEQNLGLLKNNLALFYGENVGLINEFKNKLIKDKNISTLNLTQNEIMVNENILNNEIYNISLFANNKIIFIQDANDKILKIIEEIIPKINNTKIYLFSSTLDKKSRLRKFCEKEKKIDVIPCYKDNEITIKKIINNYLNSYSGVTPNIINLLLTISSNDRVKLYNELSKIRTYFHKKTINYESLIKLLNLREDDDFNLIKDSAISGKKNITNQLLDSMVIESEKISYYISLINLRLNKLLEILMKKNSNIEKSISDLKPPIFWKDKSNFIEQLKKWNKKKLFLALKQTYALELKIKSDSNLNKQTLLKKLIVDICLIANAA